MLHFGKPPYIECSSIGDHRFSAFYARPRYLKGKSIEEAYQAMKKFRTPDGKIESNLEWRAAKGRTPINLKECQEAYRQWWGIWVKEQNLMPVLETASGLCDTFGQKGHICQAGVLWDIRNQAEIPF